MIFLFLVFASAPTNYSAIDAYQIAQDLRANCSRAVVSKARALDLDQAAFISLMDRSCLKERTSQRQAAMRVLVERGVSELAAKAQIDQSEAEIRRVLISTYRRKPEPNYPGFAPPAPPAPPSVRQ